MYRAGLGGKVTVCGCDKRPFWVGIRATLRLTFSNVIACPPPQVGGVGLLLNHEPTLMFQKAGMLAPAGRCRTLDDAADGYVRSEACGALVLGAYSADAGRGAPQPLAILTGSAVNQDGRSSALTAPNGPAQQEAIRTALAAAGAAPGALTSLELHGTGTPLGDPCEAGALAAVLQPPQPAITAGATQQQQPCPGAVALHAAKSKVGHAEAASGLSGLVHAAVALSSARLLPISHLTAVNPHVVAALEQGRDAMGRAASGAWALPRQAAGHVFAPRGDGGAALMTGVSAFAFQGTNAHAVLRSVSQPGQCSADTEASMQWRRQRFWPAPATTGLLSQVQPR